jgi:uncharacterized protein involved in exopolysaccharide biosynthesis
MSAAIADLEPVTFGDVRRFIARARWWLIAGAVVGTLLGVAAGLILTKQYRVDVVLAIVSPTDSKIGGAAGQLGGIAALVGVDLSSLSGSTGTNKGEAVETLKSRGVARRFIEQNKLLPVIYPNDTAGEHTLEQAVTRFTEKYVKVSENKASGTINFSVIWRDRQQAADWARGLVMLADGDLRARAVTEAQQSIDYLQAEVQKTNVAELRDSIYRLIDTNLRTIVIARTRSDFAFRTIDPPVPPDEKDFASPKRKLLAALGLVIGAVLAVLAFAVLRSGARTGAATAKR